MDVFVQALLIVIGFIMLVKGADYFVDGSSSIAAGFGIPQLVIGLTVVAMGTSAPEAAVSISAAFKGNADITIGNIVGSNILNVLIILGLTSVITPIAASKSAIFIDLPVCIVVTVLLLLLGIDGEIGLPDGIIFIVVFCGYIGYLLWGAKKGGRALDGASCEDSPAASDETAAELVAQEVRHFSMGKALIATLAGLFFVILGSNITVDAAVQLAKDFGVSDRFIGLTIIALGTSLPELFTSLSAARKGNADIAIGNIIGSNIFNILFVIGLSSMMIPVPFARPFIFDTAVAIAALLILMVFSVNKNHKLGRFAGVVMLCSYALYFSRIV